MLFQAGSFAEFVNSYLQEKQDEEGGLEDIDDDGEPRDVTSCEAVTSLRWCVVLCFLQPSACWRTA